MQFRILIAAGVIAVSPANAFAAEDRGKEADACQPDIHRLCDELYPDAKLVAKCLIDKRSELSPPCADALSRQQDDLDMEED